jgi:hypothetical protein
MRLISAIMASLDSGIMKAVDGWFAGEEGCCPDGSELDVMRRSWQP